MRFFIFISLVWSSVVSICHAGYLPQEIRGGVLKHDVRNGLSHKYEKGYDINAELLWSSPQLTFFEYIFSPRPHLGTSINTEKGTDQFYLGLTWRLDFLKFLFVEGSLGGEVHTGELKTKSSHKQALGCRFLFRESVSFGVQVTETHSLSLMLDHASNAGLSSHNPGLTSIGLRYGYRF